MKDALGQERTRVGPRELTIGALFLVLVGVGVWTVALPALNEDPEKHESADGTAAPNAVTPEKSPKSP